MTDPTTDSRLHEAHALATQGQFAEAAQICRVLVRQRPRDPRGWLLLGATLLRLGEVDASLHASARAVALDAQLPLAHCNLGAAHAERLELGEAQRCYARALALDPEHALTHVNRALAWLLAGEYARGFAEYEWRWRLTEVFRRPVPHPELRWNGEPMRGGRLLAYAEQGSGDMLQMARFAPLVCDRGVHLVLRCGQPLARLLRSAGVADEVSPDGTDLPPFDRHALVMSLPALLGTTLQTVPAPVPYLRPDERIAERWTARLAGERRFRVGLCWQGNPHHWRDAQRSIHPTLFAPFADVADVAWFSLQKGTGSAVDLPLEAADLAPQLHDFADTAAAIQQMDLVISVDTAVAHLAGALGRPVWILLPHAPDWRWLLGRTDSPWYPTARLFRQPARGDWPSVVSAVARELGITAARPGG